MNEFIGIRKEDFIFLTEYIEDQPVPFYKAEKAVRIQQIFRSAVPLTVTENKPDEQK